MGTKGKRTQVVVGVLALAGLLGVWTLATAGDLEPSGPPGPTMKTLDEIYDAVIEGSSGVSEREGYMEHVTIDPCGLTSGEHYFFTVPAGKQFVLMKLYSEAGAYLTVNNNVFIDSDYFRNTLMGLGTHVDFPDRCITVDANEILIGKNPNPFENDVTIVGYFYDVP